MLKQNNNNMDVPSPIDLRDLDEAKLWAEEVNLKRPWRYQIFDFYKDRINKNQSKRILELGSGPGYLAAYLLEHCDHISYTAYDFSAAMHQIAGERIEKLENESGQKFDIQYIVGDFKQTQWLEDFEQQLKSNQQQQTEQKINFDVIIIHQALHELRHKIHAAHFHAKVKSLMHKNSFYWVCDHLCREDAMQNNQLYMSEAEHIDALQQAGLNENGRNISQPMEINGLCVFQCH